MSEEQQQTLKENVLRAVKSGSVQMTPRVLFTLRFIGTLVVAIAATLTTILIFNFIVFSLRVSGHDALLGFGSRGFTAFIWFFPWYLLVVDVALVALLQWLLRQFRFGYKIPVLYLILALLIGSFTLGYALDHETTFNNRFH